MNIIEQAKNAGAELYADTLILNGKDCHDFVERFRALVLEEAAKVCEAEKVDVDACDNKEDEAYNAATDHCAAAIRALKGAKE